MNTADNNSQKFAGEVPQRAISIYGQNDGVDDFPVLKTFQQYIDAEQAKARKRMLALSAFFVLVLFSVIIVFMILLTSINSRNQLLSDRLVDYAMTENERRQVNSSSYSQNDDTIKALKDTLLSLQAKLQNDNSKEQERNVRNIQTTELEKKLVNEKALLAVEREKIAAEKERLRQLEIERYRRRMYPELYERDYYDRVSNESRSQSARRQRVLSDDDIREIIHEAYQDVSNTPRQESEPTHPSVIDSEKGMPRVAPEDEAIEYFKDDAYTIPVDVGDASKKIKFTVPVE